MDSLGKRVKRIIVYHGYTMTNFAKELNISQSMVSKICSDKATPSDRTIADICRIFNINRDWLTRGTGEMIDKPSLEAELEELVDSESSLNDTIKRSIISALVNTPPAAWPIIADYLQSLADECQKNPGGAGSYIDGYREGVRMTQTVKAMLDGLSEEPKQ